MKSVYEEEIELDGGISPQQEEEQLMASINNIVNVVLKESRAMEQADELGFVYLQNDTGLKLVKHLSENRHVPLLDASLRFIVEQMFALHQLDKKVNAAENLLRQHSIDLSDWEEED